MTSSATGFVRIQAWVKLLTSLLSVAVLIAFVVISIIVQVRDASMDSTSVKERHELKERLDQADRDREALRKRLDKVEETLKQFDVK